LVSCVSIRDDNSKEVLFPRLKAQIPGLVRVSIWTVVIRLAQQRVRQGSLRAASGFIDQHRVGRKSAVMTWPLCRVDGSL